MGNSTRLLGDVALVTGAASGLDRAIAQMLARNGATVICADINDKGNEATAEMIRAEGGTAYTVHMNIEDHASVKDAIETAYSYEKKISIFVNGAGVSSEGTLDDTSDEEWFRVLNINLSGYFYCVMEIGKYLKESGCGRVVMISSTSAKSGGSKGGPAYASSKGGVLGLMRHCAKHWAKDGIRVNCVCPAYAPTNFGSNRPDLSEEENAKLREETKAFFLEKMKGQVPLGRICTPDDIAGVVLFLVSDESAFVTGCSIDVTGGQYIYNT
jgi:NAD(P)-dependent dehydrogenase (short-subunit alcohol dehydrogenase family)